MNLSRLNLNLLPGLKALLDTQSVSKAAQIMHVTQSAMSRTLGQLREALNDPILIRKGNRVFLSEKAISLQAEVNRVVTEASNIFENQQFDPATTERHFRIASGHVVLEQVMPEIIRKVWRQAPGFSFELLTMGRDQDVNTGKLDLMIGFIGQMESGLSGYRLLNDRMCLVFCENHPLAQERLTVEALLEFPFILQRNEHTRHRFHGLDMQPISSRAKVLAHTPNLPVSLEMIRRTDCILLSTVSVQSFASNLEGIVVRDMPMQVPEMDYSMVWPDYWELNRAHRWFRELVRDELMAVIGEPGLNLNL